MAPCAAAAIDRAETTTTRTNKSILFNVSLLLNMKLRDNSARPWWSRVLPHLLLGALPLHEKRHLQTLTQHERVRAVVTLNQPSELLPNWLATPVAPGDWADANVVQCVASTGDFRTPSLDALHRCVDFIHAQVRANRTTYVHCKAGRGRSAVVAIAYLVKYHGMAVHDAHAVVASKRPHISFSPMHRSRLVAFAASVGPLNDNCCMLRTK